MPIDPATRLLLERAVAHFEQRSYVQFDPIAIPHGFDNPADQEVIGLFAAILAWGRRDTMLRKLEELCERMSYRPARFVRDFRISRDAGSLEGFKHRTFQTIDAVALCRNLSACLRSHGSVEKIAASGLAHDAQHIGGAIERLSTILLTAEPETPRRLSKHLARPGTGSACKRLSMYFRWMVRPGPFDLNAWSSIDPGLLVLPLDVHSGRQARRLRLLSSSADNWKSVLELTSVCKTLAPEDPARYDFALFGLGAYDVPPELSELAPVGFKAEPSRR